MKTLLLRLALAPGAAALTAALCVPLFALLEDGDPLRITLHVAAITLGGLLLVTLPASYLLRARSVLVEVAVLAAIGALAAFLAAWLADAPEKLRLPAAFCGGFGSLLWSGAAARLGAARR